MKYYCTILLVAANAALAQGTFVFSPFPASFNSANANPFLTITNFGASVRYQQVFQASDFSGHGGPLYRITDLSFSEGQGSMFAGGTMPNIQINFSTTPRSADGLSSVFADNVGPDNTVVSSGQLQIVYNLTDSFALHIHLQQGFVYDPAAGNLLMDVRNFQTVPGLAGMPWLMAAENTLGDTTSSLTAFDVNSTTARFVWTSGLVTRFTVQSIPEPGSISLLLLGVGGLGFWWRRRK